MNRTDSAAKHVFATPSGSSRRSLHRDMRRQPGTCRMADIVGSMSLRPSAHAGTLVFHELAPHRLCRLCRSAEPRPGRTAGGIRASQRAPAGRWPRARDAATAHLRDARVVARPAGDRELERPDAFGARRPRAAARSRRYAGRARRARHAHSRARPRSAAQHLTRGRARATRGLGVHGRVSTRRTRSTRRPARDDALGELQAARPPLSRGAGRKRADLRA